VDFPFFLLAFSSLFTLVNPIGISPAFISITSRFPPEDIRKIAFKATLAAAIILILFGLLGDLIFSFFGVTIHAFRIAGGIIFLRIGLNMLESIPSRTRATPMEEQEALTRDDIAFSPLAIPIIAGPGAITSIMILSGQANTLEQKGALAASLLITLLITYGVLQGSNQLVQRIGTTGIRIIQRIMGLILMVIAVQFIIDGLTPVVKSMLHTP